jgi:hypothetical protein
MGTEMTKRGRPRLLTKPYLIYINLRLYPGVDDDRIVFFASSPPVRRFWIRRRRGSRISSWTLWMSSWRGEFLATRNSIIGPMCPALGITPVRTH